jgi:hypothetical protein
MPATDDNTLLPFSLPPVCQKKVYAAFDGGTISSDGGVFLLGGVDKRLGLIDRLASLIPDSRDPDLISHSMADILRERVFAIACGYPDGNDLDILRKDRLGHGLATDHLAPGKHPGPARSDPAVMGHGGFVVPELQKTANILK